VRYFKKSRRVETKKPAKASTKKAADKAVAEDAE